MSSWECASEALVVLRVPADLFPSALSGALHRLYAVPASLPGSAVWPSLEAPGRALGRQPACTLESNILGHGCPHVLRKR